MPPSVRESRARRRLIESSSSWPWSQSWKCPSGFTPIEDFLDDWLLQDQVQRRVEPENYYNNEDPGMQIVGPLINDAIGG